MRAADLKDTARQSPPLPGKIAFDIDYYTARARDFEARHATTSHLTPPDYYLAYGDKYVRRFTDQLRPKLSPVGRNWLDLTSFLLQWQIEERRKAHPIEFIRLEENPAEFKQFAYSTHAEAYIRAGIAHLSLKEWCLIALTPDLGDILCLEGLRQVFKVAGHIAMVYRTSIISLFLSFGSRLRFAFIC
jgi:hypothetical protein